MLEGIVDDEAKLSNEESKLISDDKEDLTPISEYEIIMMHRNLVPAPPPCSELESEIEFSDPRIAQKKDTNSPSPSLPLGNERSSELSRGKILTQMPPINQQNKPNLEVSKPKNKKKTSIGKVLTFFKTFYPFHSSR